MPTDRHDPADRRPRRSRRDRAAATAERFPRISRPPAVRRPASSPSSRPMPTATARLRSRARSRRPAPPCLPARTSRRPSCCARRGPRADPRCLARSVSAILDGVFDHDLTPTISTPGAARALQAAAAARGVTLRCHLKIDTGMNRLGFRHDNIDRTLPDVAGSPNSKSMRSIRTSRPPTIPITRSSPSSGRASKRARAAAGNGHRRSRSSCGQQRRAFARRARLVRHGPPRTPALRSRAASACDDDFLRPALSCTAGSSP